MAGDEFQLIERFFDRLVTDQDVIIPIGDDAAVVEARGPLAVAVDTLVAGVHFPAGTPPGAIGHRALAVNLSDLAAMGATPRWCTLALTLPEADEDWLGGFAAGFFILAAAHATTLIGGDLTRGPLTVSVQVLGAVPAAGALSRAGAQPGEWLYVTGSLGDAAAGLRAFAQQQAGAAVGTGPLVQRFLWPTPRVAAGRALTGLAGACIDISDGLLADLGHICAASGCRGVIEMERLPLSDALRTALPLAEARQLALTGGDDYELLFTTSEELDGGELTQRLGVPVTRIGRMEAGEGTAAMLAGEPVPVNGGGYSHF